LNNPLRYTDPSGEIIWMPFIVLAIQQAMVGGARANLEGKNILEGAIIGAASSVVTSVVAGGLGFIAPSFNSTGVLMGDKLSLIGKYAGKSSYAAFTGIASTGAGMLTGDLLDNGRIDISGQNYQNSMKFAGLISSGLSLLSSVDKYLTWDKYNLDKRIEILRSDLNIDNLQLDIDSRGFGYTNSGNIYLTPLGLENRSISELTIFHEQFHIRDINVKMNPKYFPKDIRTINNILEGRAHLATLNNAQNYDITSRYWWNSRMLLRNTYEFSGSMPNTLELKHLWNNLIY